MNSVKGLEVIKRLALIIVVLGIVAEIIALTTGWTPP
jgi:hypothetical protein